jgi:regulator of protease activity HflC (stomatin/prohibitin superfamily)
MICAIARQAEAERTRRAKITNAEGEQQAAQKLFDARSKLRSGGTMDFLRQVPRCKV